MRIVISSASGEGDLAETRTLFRAYAAEIAFDLAYQGFAAELAGLPGCYARPGGTVLLARGPDHAALGCVAVRPEAGEGACELKRLYVRPAGRGTGTGWALVEAALSFARDAGYRRMRLDTLPQMEGAIALYRALGFMPVAAPAHDAGLGQIYFERALSPT